MGLYQIVQTILDKDGNNAKIEEMKKHTSNKELLMYLQLTYNPRVKFFIKKFNTQFPENVDGKDFTQETMEVISVTICNRKLTGNDALQFIENIYESLNNNGRWLLERMIDRTLRGGIADKMINKAFGEEVIWCKDNHYMRCSVMSEKAKKDINWERAVVQVKYDGSFHDIGKVGIRTRSGNVYDPKDLRISQADIDSIDGILSGEFVIYENERLLPREECNGLLNSALQGTPLPEKYRLVYNCWDWRPDDASSYNIPYSTRLKEVMSYAIRWIVPVKNKQVSSLDEAIQYAGELISQGHEGGVLKDLDMPWKAGTSKQQVKLKVECDIDLLVTELIPGDQNGRHANTFGSVRCQSRDGKLKVDVTGLNDSLRKQIFDNPDMIVGKVVSVMFNDIVESKGKDSASLFLPRFNKAPDGKSIIIRTDKTEADSMDDIIKIFHAVTGIKKVIDIK